MKKNILLLCSIFCFCSSIGMQKIETKAELTKKSPELVIKLDNKKRYGYRKDHLTKLILLGSMSIMISVNDLCLRSAKGGGGFGMSDNEIHLKGHTEEQYLITLRNNKILQGELLGSDN